MMFLKKYGHMYIILLYILLLDRLSFNGGVRNELTEIVLGAQISEFPKTQYRGNCTTYDTNF